MKTLILWITIACPLIVLAGCGKLNDLPDDGFVDVVGGRVAFRVVGESEGIPLLFIHGGPGGNCCGVLSKMTGVAQERPVVFYDQLGSGYSDRIVDLEQYAVVSRFVSEVASIRKELGLEKVHLIGHSWGAAVALEHLLTEDGDGVQSVIFMGPYFGTDRWIEDAKYLLAQLPEEVQAAVREAEASGDFSTDAFKAANKAFGAEYGRRYPAETPNPDCEVKPYSNSDLYNYMWGPSEFLSTGTLKSYDRVDELSKLKLPVLFLVGEFDEARPETMLEYQSMVPGSQVKVIADAGHSVPNDQPEALDKAISEFLAKVEK